MVAASVAVFHHLVLYCSLPARANDHILLNGLLLCLCVQDVPYQHVTISYKYLLCYLCLAYVRILWMRINCAAPLERIFIHAQ